ncbi:MAG: hypothetical protein GH150_06825 [Hadesarchaea archaeon]|nr:hypothetical protein [Hadesarchaea archaeon]
MMKEVPETPLLLRFFKAQMSFGATPALEVYLSLGKDREENQEKWLKG